MLDEYKYPLMKVLSFEQISAMRKTLSSCSEVVSKQEKESSYSGNKSNKSVPVSSRPKRQAAKNANIQMDLQSRNFDDSTTMMGLHEGRNMHELVEPQRYFSEKEQPCILFISLEALILMSVHASMHRNEVIGFLSGIRTRTKGPVTKKDVLIITDCNPCHSA